MCLILFAYRVVPGAPLIVAANRDEYFARPAAPAALWADHPEILAGRDLSAGGTWLGVSTTGRFAALTNFRNPADRRRDAPSRGELVKAFLTGRMSAESYVHGLAREAKAYNGFCLLVGDGDHLFFYSNHAAVPLEVQPGVHGLANHLLDTPWPKVVKGRAGLERLTGSPFNIDDHLALLDDMVPADERDLPQIGVDIERERRLSSLRILSAEYGTRCSTVVRITSAGAIDFAERSYRADGEIAGEVRYRLPLEQIRAAGMALERARPTWVAYRSGASGKMGLKVSTVSKALLFHGEIAMWLLAVIMTAAGKLRWAAAGVVVALGTHMAGRLWSRQSPVPIPYFMRWVLLVPRGPHSPTRLQRILQPRSGERILEIGPGVGVHALAVADSLRPDGVLDVLDVQQEMLDDLMRRVARAGLTNIVPRQGDAQRLPYPDSTFDAAYLISVLGEVPDAPLVLRELHRVLKPAARLLIGEVLIDPDFISLPALKKMARDAGFGFDRQFGPRFAYSAVFRSIAVGATGRIGKRPGRDSTD